MLESHQALPTHPLLKYEKTNRGENPSRSTGHALFRPNSTRRGLLRHSPLDGATKAEHKTPWSYNILPGRNRDNSSAVPRRRRHSNVVGQLVNPDLTLSPNAFVCRRPAGRSTTRLDFAVTIALGGGGCESGGCDCRCRSLETGPASSRHLYNGPRGG